jgi:antitoxin MazE
MTVAVQTRIVRIGNSQGVRIPKPLLQQAGISDRVELQVHDGHLSIHPLRQARAGWDERFAAMAAAGDDRLLDGAQSDATAWDGEEWEW